MEEKEKQKYQVAGKNYELKLSLEQYELVDPMLAGFDELELAIDDADNQEKNLEVGRIGMNVLNQVRKEGNLRKLYSYILVEEGKEFSAGDAEGNEDLFKKMDEKTIRSVFAVFFISGSGLVKYI